MLRPLCLLAALFLFSQLNLLGQDVYLGMERTDLIDTLGDPVSSVSGGSREILLFSNGAEIQLRDGEVFHVQGMPFGQHPPETGTRAPQPQSQSTPAPSPAPASSQPPAPQPQPTPAPTTLDPDNPPPIDIDDPAIWSDDAGDDAYFFEKNFGYETYEGPGRVETIIVRFGAELIGSLIVLKMAFTLFGFPCLTRQLLIIAVGQSAAAILFVSIATLDEILVLFKVDTLLSYLTLVGLIYFFSDVKQTVSALKIAAMTKVATWIFAYIGFFIFISML